MAAGELGDQVGGRRRHHDQIGLARQPDVTDVELAACVEQIGKHALAENGAGRERGDEMLRRLSENAAHGEPALFQPPDQIERLVGGNAAADDQQHALLSGRRSRGWLRIRRVDDVERRVAGFFRRRAQDGANLVFHRAAGAGRAQPQKLFKLVVELADGQRGHRKVLSS